MATAKLWWDGSAWSTSECYWVNLNTTGSMWCGILVRLQIIAYDDGTIRFYGPLGKTSSGDEFFEGSKNIYVDGTKYVYSQNNTIVDVSGISATARIYTSGSLSCYIARSGRYNGGPWSSNHDTTITSPFATITYNANGGADAPASKTALKGISTTLSGTVPTRANYTFLGWSTNPSATAADYYSGGEITVTGDTTLYAVWKVISYALTITKPITAAVTILKNGTEYSGATVNSGDVLTVTFSPSAGYFIASATLNGSPISSGDTHTVSGNVTITVTTVAQYSTIATYDSVVETLGTFHLTVNQYDPSHYCKVRYYDSNSNLLATSAAFTDSTSILIPQDWFNNFPSVSALTITAELTTYTDSSCTTQTGYTDRHTFTVNADSTMKPNLGTGCITLSPDNTGTGAAALHDPLFIKGYSKVAAVFDTTKISHANGASAASYAIIVQQVTSSAGSPSVTSSNVLTVANDIQVNYSVTDTRGRTATGTETISVYDYIAPSLQPLICKRTDSGGTEDDSGHYMTIKATANYASLSDNAPTLTLYAKAVGGAYNSYGTITDGAVTLFGNNSFSPDASYVVKVTVSDKLGNGSYLEISMPKRSWDFHLGRVNGQTGAAFGKVTEYGQTLQLASGWSFQMGSTNMSEAQLSKLLTGPAAFTVTLSSASWSGNSQTVSDVRFLASGYAYIVSPASGSFVDYTAAVIYADDVSADGSMTFHCSNTPSSNLTVNIVRMVAA